MSIKFSFISGSLTGKTEEFTQDKITLGRGSENDIQFDPKRDLDASKNHAEIINQDGDYWLQDLGSTNGTYVNGKRVNKVKLRPGDQIEFGKGGPMTTVSIAGVGPGDTSPKTRVSNAVESDKRGIGSQTVAMMISDALDKAKHSDRGAIGGTAVFIKEAVNNALKKSSRTFKVVTSLVIIGLMGAIAYLVVEGMKTKDELKEAKQSNVEMSERQSDLESKMAADKDKLYNLISQYKESVVFIYSELTIRNANGSIYDVYYGMGTGFFVRDDGYIVTGKHVIYPWKFNEDMAYGVAFAKKKNYKLDHFICVWINGVRFRAGGRFTYENSYNTRDGNLEIFTTAEDRMIQPSKRGPNWLPDIEVEVHKKDNNDIGILKAIGGPFKSVKIYRGQNPYKVTDPVVVYGFPLGISTQELANTNASPAFGRIRKIENTIQLDVSVLPGNSGGPIFTEDGYVIGIMVRRFSETLNEGIMIENAARLVPGL
jgi:pSer/pThr/pTyr-binding forkhead associated (FHA) protein